MHDHNKDDSYWGNQKTKAFEKKFGRPKNLESAGALWDHACDYFQQSDETPWNKRDYKGKEAFEVNIPTQRPYSWGAFEEYLRSNAIISKLDDYKSNKENRYADFAGVITRIGNIIRTQKMEGAIVGAYDSRIISADLALSQKVTIEVPKQVFKIGGKTIEIG